MKKKRNCILIVVVALMIIVLLGGIIISVMDAGVGNKNKEKAIKKTDQHAELFTATQTNWGLVNSQEDYWSSSYWTVYYDGTVEYYENYNLSGETSHVTWELSDEDYEKLCRNLQGRFLKCNEGVDACDGDVWSMTYYSTSGKKIHNFSGYMYGIPALEEIVEILDSDERDNVELGGMAKEDDDTEILATGAWKESTCYVGDYVMYIETLHAGHPGPDNVIHGASFDWCDDNGYTLWVNLDYVYEDKGLSEYHASAEHLKNVTVGDKEFLYEMLPEGDLWMYYSIDDETCVVLKLQILGAYDSEGDGLEVSQFDLEDILDDEILEEAIKFEVTER